MSPNLIAGPSSTPASVSASCSPAPYGRACAGCSRAKCKCFYRAEGSTCERCHRLGKVCEPASNIRKRKVRKSTPQSQSSSQRSPPPPPAPLTSTSTSRIEEKLDDLVSLLRSQAQAQGSQQSSRPTPEGNPGDFTSNLANTQPDVVIDTTTSIIHLLRPANNRTSPLRVVEEDIMSWTVRHPVLEKTAEEQLELFRRVFVSMLPFVYIPETTSAAELRRQKPFLWFVVMALTAKKFSLQFAMEETIWHIVSRRVVTQHLVDMDLLLGVICFATWSHFFKKELPFMTMLSQMAVSLAFELGIHHDTPTTTLRRSRLLYELPARQPPRTLEERRTMLALFHVTSSTWATYRKTEPLRWTPYLDECLRVIGQGTETPMDILLATQIKCQIIRNQLTCSLADEPPGAESSRAPSAILAATLLAQLNDIRQNLPAQVASEKTAQLYLHHTTLKILESQLTRPRPRPLFTNTTNTSATTTTDPSGLSTIQRLADLEAVLSSAERWLAALFGMPPGDWLGITSDVFAQFTQTLVVLFKLSTLDIGSGSGASTWDVRPEVRRRADVFEILDRACHIIDTVPFSVYGIVDPSEEGGNDDEEEGEAWGGRTRTRTTNRSRSGSGRSKSKPRPGFFRKAARLLRHVKALFLAEMPPDLILSDPIPTTATTAASTATSAAAAAATTVPPFTVPDSGAGGYGFIDNNGGDMDFSMVDVLDGDGFMLNLYEDILTPMWDFRPDNLDISFPTQVD